jgi:site-specific DNA-methyltransferase (adenine-specific)
MKPYYEQDGITIYHGDCRDVLPDVWFGVDLLLTDPPYGMDWNFTGQGSGKGAQGGSRSRFAGETIVGDREDFDPSHLLRFPRVVLWGFHHFPQHLNRGSVLVWVKKREDAYGTFLSDADLAWMKGGCGVYISKTINPASFQNDRQHPTQKPVELMKWCIQKSGTNGRVLDPYMGSGSTIVAAKELGHHAIGIEVEERYCEIAAKRLSQAVLFGYDGDVQAAPSLTAATPDGQTESLFG